MRVIFLDFDGVVNAHEWIHLRSGPKIMQRQARMLQIIIDKTGANLVVSSTWSSMILSGDMTKRGFERMLKTHGIRAEVLDALPVVKQVSPNESAAHRSSLITGWLAACRDDAAGQPDRYIVIDDLAIRGHPLIRTNPAVGLEPRHVSQAIGLLVG